MNLDTSGDTMFDWKSRCVGVVIVLFAISGLAQSSHAKPDEWKRDWGVAPGFSISSDTEGYAFPSAIAFVPDPGPGPKDPLYFVTEIRGTVKVVTNDRSVYTFAKDIVRSRPPEELPALVAETGMAGLYLEPTKGYVYVSFAYRDESDQLRNNIVRFQSVPEVFSLEPTSSIAFTEIFADEASDQSHQIGSMIVHEGHLFVPVGDARRTYLSRDVNSTLGKILRMSLDGKPVPDNPFYVDGDIKKPANFVWALGLRNPFGLTIAEGGLFAIDNGPGVDRFVRIYRGSDYLYDGSDWSVGLRAKAVFAPAVGPVRLEYLVPGSDVFPESYHSHFFITFGGFLGSPAGPGQLGERSVVTIEYDMDADLAAGAPQLFLQYQGAGLQLPVSLAFGPDALYVVHLLPDVTGKSRVLRVAYDPENEHPFVLGRHQGPRSLMSRKGCMGCHSFDPDRPMVGPTLEHDALAARLSKKLSSPEYLQSLDRLDSLDDEFYRSTRSARDALRRARGAEQLQVYVKNKALSPRFDNASSLMADLGLSENEAAVISEFLAPVGEQAGITDWPKKQLMRLMPHPRLRHVILGFAAGAGTALLGACFVFVAVRAFRRIGVGHR